MRNRATAMFAVLAVIWGSNFVWMKWATALITPGQVTLLRVLFGFVPVAGFALARGAFDRSHLRHVHHFLVMSVLATSFYYFAYASGAALLPSGIAGALSGSIPLFTFLGAALVLRDERPTLLGVSGIVTGFAGVLLVARPWDATSAVDPVGVVWMTLGSASVGLSFVYARRFLSHLEIAPSALTAYQMGLALVVLLVVVDLDGVTDLADSPRAAWGVAVGLGLLGTGVAYILYYVIVEQLGAVTASSATYLPPVVALVIGAALLGEEITVLDVAAVALILAGVLVLRRAQVVAARVRLARVAQEGA